VSLDLGEGTQVAVPGNGVVFLTGIGTNGVRTIGGVNQR